MDRQLIKHGSDWHDLAARLIAPPVTYEPGFRSPCGGVTNYREAVAWIISHDGGTLSEKEHHFAHDMQRNLHWGTPSPKQARWLDAILEKMGGYWA